ncbi:MAG: protein kinase [Gemmataceae bacterium]
MPTGVVMLQPGMPVPVPELNDDDWPRVRGYDLLMVIGTGGMGIVYMARHRELQRSVALKMLRGLGHGDEEYRERLKVEAETVAKIQHPNIIQVFEVGTVDPQPGETHPSPFISFEYVEGGSLMPFTEAPQSPAFAAGIIEKVARAVHAAHRVGVIHRDLKPANVLLTRDKEPKVADFGLAKQFDAGGDSAGRFLTRAGIVMGTPAYMAPEQAADEPLTPAIDIYALGVLLYELLTGQVPFQGSTPVETMYLVRDQEPVSPRQLQPKLPRDLETICLKCLQKDISKRYESAEALADDLARWREGRPILARPVGFLERTHRAAKRNPAIAALSLLVLLVSLAGISGVIWKWREAIEHARAAEAAAGKAREAATKSEEATKAERWERYRSHIVSAANLLQLNNVVGARGALDTAPEEYRDWEWHHLYQQLDGSVAVLRWPGVVPHFALFSKDGRLACVHEKGLRIWDLHERREVKTLPVESVGGDAIFSPDGTTIGVPSPKKGYVLYNLTSGQSRVLKGLENSLFHSKFNHDGTRVYTVGVDGRIQSWDTATGALIDSKPFPGLLPVSTSFTPSVQQMLDSYLKPNSVWLRDLKTNHRVQLHGQDYVNNGVTFNREGNRLITVGAFPINDFYSWELPSGKAIAKFSGHTNQLKGIVFNSDNTRIASSSMDQTARIWDASTGKSLAVLRGHKGWVYDVAFSPDSQRLLTASQDQTLRLWNTSDGAPLAVMRGHTSDVLRTMYIDNGKLVASCSMDATVRFWDPQLVERNGEIRGHTNFVYGVAFHPDNERVASASWDGTVRVWNATTGHQRWSQMLGEKQIVSSVAFHPAGQLLASLSRTQDVIGGAGTLRLWNVETGEELHRWNLSANWQDSRVTFSPEGNLLAAGSADGGIRLWDMKSKLEIAVLRHKNIAIRDLTFSPDGRWMAAGCEHAFTGVQIWDIANKSVVKLLPGQEGILYSLAFSRDGKYLASGATDHTVHLWDTSTWEKLAVLQNGSNVYSLAFTKDGTRIVAACADSSIRLWDVKTHHLVTELRGHESYVHSIAFSADGTRLVSGSGDNTLRIWDTLPTAKRAGLK